MTAAFALSLLLTPGVKRLAFKINAVDVPQDTRRVHDHPIPRLGGLAIFLSFLAVMLIFIPGNDGRLGMLAGVVVIVAVGIFDDIFALSAWVKLIFQIAAALLATLVDGRAAAHFGPFSIPAAVLWIVLVTNAVNLIDGLDGLACGVSAIGAVTLMIAAYLVDMPETAAIMAALVGACLGFLPYNTNPATVFMGDTGATFLGFVMAVMTAEGMFRQYEITTFWLPFLILGLPIFDTCFAVVRRISKGRNPMSPDRSHIHHKLMDLGLSQKQTVGILYTASTVLCLAALFMSVGSMRVIPILAALALIALALAGFAWWCAFRGGFNGTPGRKGAE